MCYIIKCTFHYLKNYKMYGNKSNEVITEIRNKSENVER